MNYSDFSKKVSDYILNRIIDIIGIGVITLSLFLLLSLISYSPEDPNFIFPEGQNIKNIFGFYGSFTSDLFLQSFGLISFLICLTIFYNGILIIKEKNFSIFLKNIFY